MSKILLLGNLTWYATAVYNENPNITEINDLNGLYSAVISLFTKEYEDKIMIALKDEESEDAFENKMREMFHICNGNQSMYYNGKTYDVTFGYQQSTISNLFLKVYVHTLCIKFILKQQITPDFVLFDEISIIKEICESDYIITLLHSEYQEINEPIVFGEKQSGKCRISLMIMEYLGVNALSCMPTMKKKKRQ